MSVVPSKSGLQYSVARAGRNAAVRPILPGDYGWAYELAMFDDSGARWRLRGQVPPFDQFVQFLFQNAHAVVVLEQLEGRAPIGFCQLWNYDPANRTGHITALLDPRVQGRGWPMEGIFLFVDYCFAALSLRKLYFEETSSDAPSYLANAPEIFSEEARLLAHTMVGGVYRDAVTYALYKSNFDNYRDIIAPHLRPYQVRRQVNKIGTEDQ